MNYLGLTLHLADDCEPDENVLAPIIDYDELFEAVDNGAVGIALDDGGWIIENEPELRSWCEKHLRGEDWEKLHEEREDHAAFYEQERREMLADWMGSR